MMKWLNLKVFLLVGAVLFACSGCGSGQGRSEQGKTSPVPTKWEQSVDQTPSRQAEKQIIKRKDVTEVIAANSNKELMVGLKLKTLARFNTMQIVSEVQKKLQKQYPKVKVEVSSDIKVYSEIKDLKKQLAKGKIRSSSLKQKMKRINKFVKEQNPSKQ